MTCYRPTPICGHFNFVAELYYMYCTCSICLIPNPRAPRLRVEFERSHSLGSRVIAISVSSHHSFNVFSLSHCQYPRLSASPSASVFSQCIDVFSVSLSAHCLSRSYHCLSACCISVFSLSQRFSLSLSSLCLSVF